MIFRATTLSRGLLALTVAAFLLLGSSFASQPPQKKPQPKVEVVFVLDTTGSMGGLISAAKQKIWSICNQIVSGTPTPEVKIGLVAYRGRGDQYVTKVFDLTENLDEVHANVMSFQAAGGGDEPESVNQALHEAVTKISWNKEKGVLKLIFLVGDAPPHMDYANDIRYPETCKLAVTNDIIINTVLCGNNPRAKEHWTTICRLAEGRFVQIDAQGGAVIVVETPFDKDLAKINAEMLNTVLVFGDAKQQNASKAVVGGAGKGGKGGSGAKGLADAAAADRAGFYGQTGKGPSYDLLQNIKDGKVMLESLKKDELPVEMRNMTLDEQKTFLNKIDKERQELNAKARDLDKQRSDYIAQKLKEQAKNAKVDSFDGQVLQLLQQQAERIQVDYGTVQKKK